MVSHDDFIFCGMIVMVSDPVMIKVVKHMQ